MTFFLQSVEFLSNYALEAYWNASTFLVLCCVLLMKFNLTICVSDKPRLETNSENCNATVCLILHVDLWCKSLTDLPFVVQFQVQICRRVPFLWCFTTVIPSSTCVTGDVSHVQQLYVTSSFIFPVTSMGSLEKFFRLFHLYRWSIELYRCLWVCYLQGFLRWYCIHYQYQLLKWPNWIFALRGSNLIVVSLTNFTLNLA